MQKPTLVPNIEGVNWDITLLKKNHSLAKEMLEFIHPVCPKDGSPLAYGKVDSLFIKEAECQKCNTIYIFSPKSLGVIQREIANKYVEVLNQKAEYLDLDGELTPIVKPKRIKVNERYDIELALKKSKRGTLQVMALVFDKNRTDGDKVQLLGDLEYKTLRFDQSNLHPLSIMSKIEMTFEDGTTNKMERRKRKTMN